MSTIASVYVNLRAGTAGLDSDLKKSRQMFDRHIGEVQGILQGSQTVANIFSGQLGRMNFYLSTSAQVADSATAAIQDYRKGLIDTEDAAIRVARTIPIMSSAIEAGEKIAELVHVGVLGGTPPADKKALEAAAIEQRAIQDRIRNWKSAAEEMREKWASEMAGMRATGLEADLAKITAKSDEMRGALRKLGESIPSLQFIAYENTLKAVIEQWEKLARAQAEAAEVQRMGAARAEDEAAMGALMIGGREYLDQLQMELETLEMTTRQAELYRRTKEGLAGADLQAAQALVKEIEVREREREEWEAAMDAADQFEDMMARALAHRKGVPAREFTGERGLEQAIAEARMKGLTSAAEKEPVNIAKRQLQAQEKMAGSLRRLETMQKQNESLEVMSI